jgi:DNA polymerase-3 subunit alpha
MDEPAHNFVANNGLITCNSHAAAYAIIAYICMYLKTYHPKEFLCAWINSVSTKIEKVSECVTEANRLKVPVYLGKYNNCSATTTLYKDGIMMGTNTIKYCSADVANELHKISDKKYNSFIELLDALKETSLESRHLKILTGLNFFSEFGKNKYLLNIIDLYYGIKVKVDGAKSPKTVLPSLRDCSTIKKEKIESYAKYGVTELILRECADKETPKQFSQIDNIRLLNTLMKNIPNKSMKIREYVKFEKEYLNYTTYKSNITSDIYYIVVDFTIGKDTTKPRLILRNMKTGEEIKTRIKQSKIYKEKPFGCFEVLKVNEFSMENKTKLINGEWQKSDELEPILSTYEVMSAYEVVKE